ncbi:hypothetical protein OCE56_25990 [Bacillus cereus]|nr:hypothetical protein [Bacillus cereus]
MKYLLQKLLITKSNYLIEELLNKDPYEVAHAMKSYSYEKQTYLIGLLPHNYVVNILNHFTPEHQHFLFTNMSIDQTNILLNRQLVEACF